MRSSSEYKSAIKKHRTQLLFAGLVAYALFITGLWGIVLFLGLFRSQLAPTIDYVRSSPFLQFVAVITVFGLGSLPALVFLSLAVGRIRRSSDLYCHVCATKLFTDNAERHIQMLSKCPNCNSQIISDLPPSIDSLYFQRQTQQHWHLFRFATVAVSISLPVLYVILAWGKQQGAYPNADWPALMGFPVIFAAALLGPFYIATKASINSLYRARSARQRVNNVQHEGQGM